MKTKFLALVITIVVSFSVNAMDVSQAQEAVVHAERNYSAALGSYKNEAYYSGSGVVGSAAESNLKNAAEARSQAYADLRSAEQEQQSNAISNYGVKTNPVGNPVSMISGTKQNPMGSPVGSVVGKTGTNTINVNVSTLNPNTKIQTKVGVVTAGTLPKDAQVTVSFNSVFSSPVKGGNDHSTGRSNGEHGTGNGANNAANSNSAHGLGGGSNIGGGRSGGGFHY